MGILKILNETSVDVTVISNYFVDNYMKDANDAQLKVYLYILRMLQSQADFSISDIADQFNHTEREVLRALKYWEKQKLMELTFDSAKNLTALRLLDPTKPQASTDTAKAVDVPVTETPAANSSAAEAPVTEVPSVEVAVTKIPAADKQTDSAEYIKPNYSLDQLKAFKEQENTAQLLFIAQAYVGKPLSPSDIKTILFMSDVLQFSDDLIDYLIQYCVEKGKRDFRYIEKVAINWAEEGIRTPKQAEKMILKYDKSVYAIMNELGKTSTPTTKEMEFINRWIKEYGFGNDVILEACARTVLATDKHRFEYADGILNNWKNANVHHKSDIKKLDDTYAQKRTQNAKPAANKFNQFTQNSYDFDELEKALLNNRSAAYIK